MKQKSNILTKARKWAAVGCVLAGVTIAIAATPQDAAAATKKADKPNIVLINMDNFGYGELGCYGGGILRGGATPRIDKLASEGEPAWRDRRRGGGHCSLVCSRLLRMRLPMRLTIW